MRFGRLLRSRHRHDPPASVLLRVWVVAVAKADGFLVGPKDEELGVTNGLEGVLVKGDGGFVVSGGDGELGMVDHFKMCSIEE